MAKKNLANLETDLSALANTMPSQKVEAGQRGKPAKVEPQEPAEEISQFAFGLRKSQRKQLSMLAMDKDMTMRAFVLMALKKQGLDVTKADLEDLRKRKGN